MIKVKILKSKPPTHAELKIERDNMVKMFYEICDLIKCSPDVSPIPMLEKILNNYQVCRKKLFNLTKQEG